MQSHNTGANRILLLLLLVAILAAGLPARSVVAQDSEGLRLVNISGSGSASQPVVWAGPGYQFQAFWWDAFDGVTTSVYRNGSWSVPVAAPLEYPMPSPVKEFELVPTEQMASIVAGSDGWAHAIWQGPENEDTKLIPLLHSAMPFGEHAWSEAHKISDEVSAWKVTLSPGNKLHLVYFQSQQVDELQPGAYYRQSLDGGLSWSEATLLDESLHYRRTTQETSHIDIVADGLGYVLATWNDPRTGEAIWTRSADAGATWRKPVPVSEAEEGAVDARMLLGYGGQAIALWQSYRATVGAGLYQWRSTDGGYTRTEVERLFSHLRLETAGMGTTWAPTNDLLVFAGSGSTAPMLLGWGGESGWLAPRRIQVQADQEQQLAGTRIDTWEAARSGGMIALLGASEDQEIWGAITTVDSLLETAQELPSIWDEPLSAASSGIDDWGEPINLSRSGAASSPQLVSGPNGTLQAFWMDKFDGMVSSYCDGDQWYAAQQAPILAQQVSVRSESGQQTTALMPLDFMPEIAGDGDDGIHAFWIVPPADADDTSRQLMHAALTIGDVEWREAQLVDDAALAWHAFHDGQGGLHLIYVRSDHTADRPSGVYHTMLNEHGAWREPVLLDPSIYARILDPEQVLLDGAADGAGNVFVAWNDQREAVAAYALSQDNGLTFGAPLQVGVTEGTVPRVVARGEGQFTTLLSLEAASGGTALYQQFSTDGAMTWTQPERVMGDEQIDLRELDILPIVSGDVVAVDGQGGMTIGLLVWDKELSEDAGATGWSKGWYNTFDIESSETGLTSVRLIDVKVAATNGVLAAIGQGADGEVWIQSRSIRDIAWAFQELPPWSQPEAISGILASDLSMVRDESGVLYVLWDTSDEDRLPGSALVLDQKENLTWMAERQVLSSPFGFARQPKLVSLGDKLVAVWNGGQYGQVFCSTSFERDARDSSGWSEPVTISMPPGSRGATEPDLAVDLAGKLHLVYAVPSNDHRGIFYAGSEDGGATWSAPISVFDADAQDWHSVAQPRVAVDFDGRLYVIFGRKDLLGTDVLESLHVAMSIDNGQTWTDPQTIAEGQAKECQMTLVKEGQAHVLWRDVETGRGWRHSWTDDGGHSWHEPDEISASTSFVGRPGVASDLQGTLYCVGMVLDREQNMILRMLSWTSDSERWRTSEDLEVTLASAEARTVWLGASPQGGVLDVVLMGVETTLDGPSAELMYHLQRDVPVPGTLPERQFTPAPTLTPTAGPVPTPTPEPKPTVNVVPPRMDTPTVDLGPISLPIMSLVGLGAVGLFVALVLAVRLVRRRNRYGSYYYYDR